MAERKDYRIYCDLVTIDHETKKRLKLYCVKEGMKMWKAVKDAVNEWLDKKEEEYY